MNVPPNPPNPVEDADAAFDPANDRDDVPEAGAAECKNNNEITIGAVNGNLWQDEQPIPGVVPKESILFAGGATIAGPAPNAEGALPKAGAAPAVGAAPNPELLPNEGAAVELPPNEKPPAAGAAVLPKPLPAAGALPKPPNDILLLDDLSKLANAIQCKKVRLVIPKCT